MWSEFPGAFERVSPHIKLEYDAARLPALHQAIRDAGEWGQMAEVSRPPSVLAGAPALVVLADPGSVP